MLTQARIRALLGALLALVLLALLSPPAALATPTRVRFAFSASDPTEREHYLEMIDAFNASRDDIEVLPVPRQWEGYGIFDTYVRFLALQDPSIDIYLVDLPWIPEFAQPGWLTPLDDMMGADELAQVAPNALQWGRYQGALYGLPLTYKGNLLFYRQDWLDDAGLAPPSTLEELARAARTLRRSGVAEVGLALHALYFHNDVFPFFFASEGAILEDGALKLASPQNTRTLEALIGLFEGTPSAIPRDRFYGEWSRRYAAPLDDFIGGEAAFLISWSPDWHEMQEPTSAVRGRVGVAAVPGLRPDDPGGASMGSWYLTISAASHHPREALEFIRFATSPEQQRERLSRLSEVPTRLELLGDEALLERHPYVRDMADILHRAGARPRVPDERAFDAVIERHLHRAVRGEAAPGAALQAAQTELSERLTLEHPRAPTTLGLPPLQDPPDRVQPWHALAVSAGIAALLVLLAIGLVWIGHRSERPLLRSLRSKLLVFSITLCLVLLDIATGFFLSGAISDQANELATGRQYLRERMANHAVTLAKNLSLSASILADTQADDRDTLETNVMGQLTVASHFSEDLLFLELWARDGSLLIDDRDTLYLGDRADTSRPREASTRLRERILTRNTTIAEVTPEGGGQPFIEVVVPVHRRGAHVGALRVGVSEAKLFEQLARIEARHAAEISDIITYSLLSFIVLFLASAGASVWLSRRLAQPLVELTRAAEAVREGDLDVVVPTGPRDEIGQLAATMAEMIQGLRDRDFIQETLGRYVDPSVAQRFLDDPSQLALGGSSREVTIIMSDLRGFSRLSHHLGPEATVHTLNRYFTAMFAVIHRHGGLINEVRGDGLLILFGVPEATPDSPARAIACAIDMQRAMLDFNAEAARQELPQLEMGIGIHRGRVIAGNIGSEQRAKFGVVGDTINLAARIESLTRAGEVFVSADVIEGLLERAEVEPPQRVRLKGQSEPIEIYSVLRFDDVERPPRDEDAPTPREVDLAVALFGIHDKRVDETPVEARVIEVAGERLRLRIDPEHHADTREWLAHVTLPGGGVTGDIYLKAEADADHDGGDTLDVFITSILDEDQRALTAAAEEDEGERG